MIGFSLMALAVFAAVAGGVIAAKLSKIEIWKGALVSGCAAVAALLASFVPGIDRDLSMPMAALIVAGVVGATIGLTPARTANIAIGAALPPLLGFLLLEVGL